MFKTTSVFISLLVMLVITPLTRVHAQSDDNIVQTVVHLLSYVSMDYSGAVRDGKIINEQEYNEQIEFSEQAYDMLKETSSLSGEEKTKLLSKIEELEKRIADKRPEEDISSLANNINNRIIQITGIQTAPKIWPNIDNGKAIYAQNCAACHGDMGKGDGIAGKSLDPPPSNFHDPDLMDNFSPFQAYSSIRLGVPGTAMQAYSDLNDAELWDLAFYVKSLRFEEETGDSLLLRKAFKDIKPEISLAEVANLTDKELLDTLNTKTDDASIKLIALRSLMPTGKDAQNSLPIAKKGLKAALGSYSEGNKTLARTQAISAYLEGIEPVEARLRTQNSAFVLDLEQQMFNVRQAIDKDKGINVLQDETNKALALISQADQLMKDQQLNYWLTFIIAASIMLREALEAFLVLAVVLALIRNSGVKKALPWLHGGWIAAVVMGIIGWFLSDYIIQFGGKNREIMEGLVSLLAVFVLIFVGFWLHNKSHAKQWTEFIQNKIGRYLKRDRMFGLAAFSFMVVFREAFEVILFLQAISLEASAENQSAIGLGVLAAVVCVAIIAFIFLKYSRMVPVRKLFLYSSWVIVLLAIILMGKGFHSLQESGWISVTSSSSPLRIDWLGIYPTVETIAAQLVLIAIVIITYFIHGQRRKRVLTKASA